MYFKSNELPFHIPIIIPPQTKFERKNIGVTLSGGDRAFEFCPHTSVQVYGETISSFLCNLTEMT